MSSDAVLRATVEYARNGDAGALRALRARFPGLDGDALAEYERDSVPFSAWAARVARNRAVVEETAADAPPELIDEVSEALSRLTPAERDALRRALNQSE